MKGFAMLGWFSSAVANSGLAYRQSDEIGLVLAIIAAVGSVSTCLWLALR